MKINPDQEIKRITQFIKTTLDSQAITKAVIAVSGGLDSALTLALSLKAIGKENIFTLELPYKRQSTNLSHLIINHLNIPQNQRRTIKLSRAIDKLATQLNAKKDPLRFGNILARTRMICLFDLAKSKRALVIGTENKSENLLGYYTRFGDQASDLDPLSHLYKTQVQQLSAYLKLPKAILQAPPSAGLWPNQTDATELGFSYTQADPILNLLIDQKLTPTQVIKKAFDKTLVNNIKKRLQTIDFKSKVPYHL